MRRKTVVIAVEGGIVTAVSSNMKNLQAVVLDHDNAADPKFDPSEDLQFDAIDFEPGLKPLLHFRQKYAKEICCCCLEPCSAYTAHRHQGAWIGDECCWTEHLPSSE